MSYPTEIIFYERFSQSCFIETFFQCLYGGSKYFLNQFILILSPWIKKKKTEKNSCRNGSALFSQTYTPQINLFINSEK